MKFNPGSAAWWKWTAYIVALVGLFAFGLAGAAWFFVPLLDRRSSRGEPSPWLTVIGVLALLFIATMTLLGYVMP